MDPVPPSDAAVRAHDNGQVGHRRPLAVTLPPTHLLHYLWKESRQRDTHCRFFVPDTIVYRRHAVDAWFYSCQESGVMKRKPRAAIDNRLIEDELGGKETGAHSIIAAFYNTSLVNGEWAPAWGAGLTPEAVTPLRCTGGATLVPALLPQTWACAKWTTSIEVACSQCFLKSENRLKGSCNALYCPRELLCTPFEWTGAPHPALR